jgi:signal peptidase II
MKNFFVFRIHRLCLAFALVFSTIGCDQATKIVARDTLPSVGAMTYLNNTIRLEYAENPGAFLNFGATLSHEWRFWIFTVAISIFLLLLAVQIWRRPWNLPVTVAASLILGGGIGNIIDRVARGNVIDFLNLGIGNVRTGIFNIADVAIMAGVLLLVIHTHFQKAR